MTIRMRAFYNPSDSPDHQFRYFSPLLEDATNRHVNNESDEKHSPGKAIRMRVIVFSGGKLGWRGKGKNEHEQDKLGSTGRCRTSRLADFP